MAWTAPMTFVDGAVLTAAQMNTFMRDDMLETMPSKAVDPNRFFVTESYNQIEPRHCRRKFQGQLGITESTSFTDLEWFDATGGEKSIGPIVTTETGTRAVVLLASRFHTTSEFTHCHMSFEVSGASNIQADDEHSIVHRPAPAGNVSQGGRAVWLDNLTAGINTFTAKYRAGPESGSARFTNRRIAVFPL